VELREKNALTYDVSSIHNKGTDFGYLSINCAVKEKKVSNAQKIIFKELSRLRTKEVSAQELERNKNLILAEILRGMDNSNECLEIIAYLEMQFKNEQALADYISKIKAVTSVEIMQAANVYLQEDNLSIAMLKPEK
jgi:zinc protease